MAGAAVGEGARHATVGQADPLGLARCGGLAGGDRRPRRSTPITLAETGNPDISGTHSATTRCPTGLGVTEILVTAQKSDGNLVGVLLRCADDSLTVYAGGDLNTNNTTDGLSACPNSNATGTGVTVTYGAHVGGCESTTTRIGNTNPSVDNPKTAATTCPDGTVATGLIAHEANALLTSVSAVALSCSDGSSSPLVGAAGTPRTSPCGSRMVGVFGHSGDIVDGLGPLCLGATQGELSHGTERGDGGGTATPEAGCPAATSLVGLVVRTGQYFGASVVTSVQGTCAPTPSLDELGTTTDVDGVSSAQCPAGSRVTGMHVRANDSGAFTVVDAVSLRCSDGSSSVTIGPAAEGDLSGDSNCNGDDPAVGIAASGGDALDSLGVDCVSTETGSYQGSQVGGQTGTSLGDSACSDGATMVGLTMSSGPFLGLTVAKNATVICSTPATTTVATVSPTRIGGAATRVDVDVTAATNVGPVTGYVEFYRDGVKIAKVTAVEGTAGLTVKVPTAASDIVAVYTGDNDYSRSVSAPVSIQATAIDSTPPTASVKALPVVTIPNVVALRFTGADAGAGVDYFQYRSRTTPDTEKVGPGTRHPRRSGSVRAWCT